MEYIYEYGLFLAQALTFVAAIILVTAGLVAIGQRQKTEQKYDGTENHNRRVRLRAKQAANYRESAGAPP